MRRTVEGETAALLVLGCALFEKRQSDVRRCRSALPGGIGR
jgi:hypothetical protein